MAPLPADMESLLAHLRQLDPKAKTPQFGP
jgi:hypothetical protein